MSDPLVSLAAFSLALAQAPAAVSGDPGPSPYCPQDMRLVSGVHYENVAHVCLDARQDTSDTHCYKYQTGISVLEGPSSDIRVCVDQYEAPNLRGARPKVMASYKSATKWCEKRRKRLCSEQEWELSCEGPSHLPLAYGWAVNVNLCNSNKRWKQVNFEAFGKTREESRAETNRLWQGSSSGRYKSCVSPFGVFDMMGNVEEWVGSRKTRRWPGSLMGGFWAKPWTGCRGTNDAHRPQFAFYETGFRCCKDPQKPAAPPKTVAPQKVTGAPPTP